MNKWKKRWIPIFMALMLIFSGCGADVQEESQPSKDQTVTEQQQETVEQEDWEIIDESEPTINIGEIPEYSGEAYVTIANNIPNFTDSELKTESFETYSDLDSLGRCGIAYANIGQDLMPTEDRGSIGQVKPSGWHTVKYDCVDGKYLYNRCHLIGFQLTAENANTKNLITGTRYLNVEGILFNVYCYNVQPGVTIDYATGESQLSNDSGSSAGNTEENIETENEQKPESSYVLNTNIKKFHSPSCSSLNQMNENNKEEFTGTRDELIQQGYESCKRCNP